MSSYMVAIEEIFVHYAQQVPLELFTFFGALIEEVLAPIPSPLVMTLAGSIAQAQHTIGIYLFWIALVGAFGKTIGSWIVYVISDKAEDLIVNKFGKFLGVSHKEIESIGKHFHGGWRDVVILTLARALPIMPTAPVSITAGVIKLDMKTYIIGTFVGTYLRNLMYLYLGYGGLASFEVIMSGLTGIESLIQIIMLTVLFCGIAVIYYRRSKTDYLSILKRKLKLDK